MKFSESWLRQSVNPSISTEDLVAQITMAGLEVDGVESASPDISGVVVGEIISIEQHPDADKLRVCQVAGNGDTELQVVCGAPNARVGIKVPFATVGAKLPEDFNIKKAKLRGVESLGMLCGQTELALGDDDSGLWELPADATVGQDLLEYLDLNDNIIEVDLTPNRADCLSIRGLAREVGVLNSEPVKQLKIDAVEPTIKDSLKVSIEAPQACGRYAGRIVRGVDLTRPTPLWMQERLRRSGIRTLGPAVDITNYVLLELGQPMHAFDLAKIDGDITVRMGQGETLQLLDDSKVKVVKDTLVIADQSQSLAMAGIMGGADSAVSDSTTDIFFESAWFDPIAIAGKARNYGKHTDSSHRFERGVDSELQIQALERATALMLDICGGNAGPVASAEASDYLPKPASIELRDQHLAQQLGVSIEPKTVDQMLTRLGLTLEQRDADKGVWQSPSWRFDLAIEQDLVEEVARVYGYNNLPVTTPAMAVDIQARKEAIKPLEYFRDRLVSLGYQEAITYSFVDPQLLETLDPQRQGIKVSNPISQDLSVMRTSLWPGLVNAAIHNLNRQQARVRLFEVGQCFIPSNSASAVAGLEQNLALGGLICGSRLPVGWTADKEQVDFYDLKGDLEAILTDNQCVEKLSFRAAAHPVLHPGQSAEVLSNNEIVGLIGRLHPAIESKLEIAKPLYLFHVDIGKINEFSLIKAKEVSKFPEVRRDLAFVVDASIPAQLLIDEAKAVAGDSLNELKLFDVYHGKDVENKGKSIALGLTFQHSSRTLTDEEINQSIDKVVNRLSESLGAELRS
ncbi:MAG: phenylalanine--tRNA ligase subunit beta [Porticoccaceae bacterium]|nr:phenylalanine--tRNA ligase subunit beta [Porticoccaceae bacterium]